MRTGGMHWRKRVYKGQVAEVRFILTHTQSAADVGGVAGLAGAAVGAQTVDALTILAQVPHHTTLINIWTQTVKASCFYLS